MQFSILRLWIAQWLVLLATQGGLYGYNENEVKLCIGYTSFQKYTTKNIKPMSNRNKITCVCEKCINLLLFKSDLNKLWLKQMSKFEKLFHNVAPTRLGKRTKYLLILMQSTF